MGEEITIAKWYEGCLVLVGKSEFDALLTRIRGEKGLITQPVRGSEHFIFTSAYEVEMDAQGRMVIPESLIAYGGFGEDVYFLGVGDRVEIWSKQAWDGKEKEIVKEAPEYIEQLTKNGK